MAACMKTPRRHWPLAGTGSDVPHFRAIEIGLGGFEGCVDRLPPHTSGRVLTATRLLTGGKIFLMTELAARLVNSGAADDISKLVAAEIAERVAMVREIFAGCEFNSYETAPFIWLKLPEPWLSGTFKTAAEREKVLIDSEDEFKTGRSDRTFHRVRIAFSNPVDRDVVRSGLLRLRALLESGAGGYESYD